MLDECLSQWAALPALRRLVVPIVRPDTDVPVLLRALPGLVELTCWVYAKDKDDVKTAAQPQQTESKQQQQQQAAASAAVTVHRCLRELAITSGNLYASHHPEAMCLGKGLASLSLPALRRVWMHAIDTQGIAVLLGSAPALSDLHLSLTLFHRDLLFEGALKTLAAGGGGEQGHKGLHRVHVRWHRAATFVEVPRVLQQADELARLCASVGLLRGLPRLRLLHTMAPGPPSASSARAPRSPRASSLRRL